jgi:hypothetical protein
VKTIINEILELEQKIRSLDNRQYGVKEFSILDASIPNRRKVMERQNREQKNIDMIENLKFTTKMVSLGEELKETLKKELDEKTLRLKKSIVT